MKTRSALLPILLVVAGCAHKPTVSIVGEYSNKSGFVECRTGKQYMTVFPDTLGFRFQRALQQLQNPGSLVHVELTGYISESSDGQARITVMGFGSIANGGCGA
jgi:hypothetical protein